MTRILIIDDEVQIREMLREAFKDGGYEVMEAQDGAEGMKKVQEAPMALVVMDILMPEREGLETIRALRLEYPDVKIVAISGGLARLPELDVLFLASKAGAHRTFQKPFHLHELLEASRLLLED
jgi:DNA-binding response OmpR family regulator